MSVFFQPSNSFPLVYAFLCIIIVYCTIFFLLTEGPQWVNKEIEIIRVKFSEYHHLSFWSANSDFSVTDTGHLILFHYLSNALKI